MKLFEFYQNSEKRKILGVKIFSEVSRIFHACVEFYIFQFSSFFLFVQVNRVKIEVKLRMVRIRPRWGLPKRAMGSKANHCSRVNNLRKKNKKMVEKIRLSFSRLG